MLDRARQLAAAVPRGEHRRLDLLLAVRAGLRPRGDLRDGLERRTRRSACPLHSLDERADMGKVAQPVPVMLSRALELFTTQLLRSAGDVADLRGARTLTPSHLATVIQTDSRMDFLRTLVEKVPRAETATSKKPGEEVIKKPARGAKDRKSVV